MGAAAAIRATAHSSGIASTVADASYARLDVQVVRFFRRFMGPIWPSAGVPVRWFGERLIGPPVAVISPIQAIASISPRPVLIIQGTRDSVVDVRDARRLYQAASTPKTLWLVDAGSRGMVPGHNDIVRLDRRRTLAADNDRFRAWEPDRQRQRDILRVSDASRRHVSRESIMAERGC
jgi:fermentation-respiration switch protein FrsA (DUF1100 family)